MTRDTATYPPLMMSVGRGQKAKSRSLRHLAETELGLSIQAGQHSPVDDARSTLYLYHKHRKVCVLPAHALIKFMVRSQLYIMSLSEALGQVHVQNC